MSTPREKYPLAEQFSPEEYRTHDSASSRTASPTHYQRTIPTPDAKARKAIEKRSLHATPMSNLLPGSASQKLALLASVKHDPGPVWSCTSLARSENAGEGDSCFLWLVGSIRFCYVCCVPGPLCVPPWKRFSNISDIFI